MHTDRGSVALSPAVIATQYRIGCGNDSRLSRSTNLFGDKATISVILFSPDVVSHNKRGRKKGRK